MDILIDPPARERGNAAKFIRSPRLKERARARIENEAHVALREARETAERSSATGEDASLLRLLAEMDSLSLAYHESFDAFGDDDERGFFQNLIQVRRDELEELIKQYRPRSLDGFRALAQAIMLDRIIEFKDGEIVYEEPNQDLVAVLLDSLAPKYKPPASC